LVNLVNSLRSGTLLLVVILLASEKSVGVAAAADGFDNMTVLAIVNGPNEIDLDGDGRKDLVFSARRKNFNAHAYSHITFYRATGGTNPRWELIPFFDRKDVPTVDSFRTVEGADCILRDLRVLRPSSRPDAPVIVVTGEREPGQSFADRALVRFVVYHIERNSQGVPGTPEVFFRAVRTIDSTAKHCDIGEAFAAELGLRK